MPSDCGIPGPGTKATTQSLHDREFGNIFVPTLLQSRRRHDQVNHRHDRHKPHIAFEDAANRCDLSAGTNSAVYLIDCAIGPLLVDLIYN